MQPLNRQSASVSPAPPERTLQFGGGNFVRGFADWIVEVYNRQQSAPLGVVVVNNTDRQIYRAWSAQDGLYHVLTKGISDGNLVDRHELVTCISRVLSLDKDWEAFLQTAEQSEMRYIFSNTTEAGIRFSESDAVTDAPPAEFPAKLTSWLHRRFDTFKGGGERGCIVIPMELVVDNGTVLREKVLQYVRHWELSEDFVRWIEQSCTFCNTLVDRIVPGVGKEELPAARELVGYEDAAITQGEPYHLLAIEAPAAVRKELPLDDIGLNIIYTDDLTPYRRSKVAILNGAHTTMVPVAYLCGRETVRETLEDDLTGSYVRDALYEEIIPILDLPGVDLQQFAREVLDRFRNPFIHHRLLSISLNSVSKYRERVLPSVLAYHEQRGEWPRRLILSLAALVRFYRGERDGAEIPLKDDPWVIEFLRSVWAATDGSPASLDQLTRKVLGWERAWGRDLSVYPDLHQLLAAQLREIEANGMNAAVAGV